MLFDAAIVREQGVTFVVVAVRRGALSQSITSRDNAAREFSAAFENLPVVLMEQDSKGTPRYYGRNDLVRFLASVYVEQLPWRKCSLSA
jgi:hypothetical protein